MYCGWGAENAANHNQMPAEQPPWDSLSRLRRTTVRFLVNTVWLSQRIVWYGYETLAWIQQLSLTYLSDVSINTGNHLLHNVIEHFHSGPFLLFMREENQVSAFANNHAEVFLFLCLSDHQRRKIPWAQLCFSVNHKDIVHLDLVLMKEDDSDFFFSNEWDTGYIGQYFSFFFFFL